MLGQSYALMMCTRYLLCREHCLVGFFVMVTCLDRHRGWNYTVPHVAKCRGCRNRNRRRDGFVKYGGRRIEFKMMVTGDVSDIRLRGRIDPDVDQH